jgi:predicted anti-sigma-YlaC factor YlaD
MTNHSTEHGGHLTPREVSRFVDGSLSPAESHPVEAHLAVCSRCLAETVEIGRLVRARARRRRLVVAVPTAAVAALGILLFATGSPEPEPFQGQVFRDAGTGVQRFEVVAPSNDIAIVADSLRFVWRSAGADVQYALSVTDMNGSPVLSQATSDTTLLVRVAPNFPAGQTYFWFVDALFNDGESATTGIHRFAVPP